MIDVAMMSKPGGREHNEDYILQAKHGNDICLILCDGLGGHECGEVASGLVAHTVAEKFEQGGDYSTFLADAYEEAQEKLLAEQKVRDLENAMKTTLVVLVITEEQIKWAHIGDSRLYHIFNDGTRYERTKDHSLVQLLVDGGELKEEEIRTSPDRNKIMRAMGAPWGKKTYDLSAVLERGDRKAFALMTDGFWEYVMEDEMLSLLKKTDSAESWMCEMEKLVLERADMTKTDNYSCICAIIPEG